MYRDFDKMWGHLVNANITGHQLERAKSSDNEEVKLWLNEVYDNYFMPLFKVYCRHPAKTWQYYFDNKVDLQEVRLYRLLTKKLYKFWYETRPLEVAKKVRNGKKDSNEEPISGTADQVVAIESSTISAD